MVTALLIILVSATLAILTTLWIIHKRIQARLDHMTAQGIINRRRARLHPATPTPEQRRAHFRLIQGGGIVALILAAGTWIHDQTRGLGARTALAAVSGSALLLGGSSYAFEETIPDDSHMTLPVITHETPTTPSPPPTDKDRPEPDPPPDLEAAAGPQNKTTSTSVNTEAPSPGTPDPPQPDPEPDPQPEPEPTPNPPPESEPAPDPPQEHTPPPDPDSCLLDLNLVLLKLCV